MMVAAFDNVADSLAAAPGDRFDLVLTNPPFGKKSSVTFVNEEGESKPESQVIVRDDFRISTSNKQLNFIQHIKTILKINSRAAVVVPDNVLLYPRMWHVFQLFLALPQAGEALDDIARVCQNF